MVQIWCAVSFLQHTIPAAFSHNRSESDVKCIMRILSHRTRENASYICSTNSYSDFAFNFHLGKTCNVDQREYHHLMLMQFKIKSRNSFNKMQKMPTSTCHVMKSASLICCTVSPKILSCFEQVDNQFIKWILNHKSWLTEEKRKLSIFGIFESCLEKLHFLNAQKLQYAIIIRNFSAIILINSPYVPIKTNNGLVHVIRDDEYRNKDNISVQNKRHWEKREFSFFAKESLFETDSCGLRISFEVNTFNLSKFRLNDTYLLRKEKVIAYCESICSERIELNFSLPNGTSSTDTTYDRILQGTSYTYRVSNQISFSISDCHDFGEEFVCFAVDRPSIWAQRVVFKPKFCLPWVMEFISYDQQKKQEKNIFVTCQIVIPRNRSSLSFGISNSGRNKKVIAKRQQLINDEFAIVRLFTKLSFTNCFNLTLENTVCWIKESKTGQISITALLPSAERCKEEHIIGKFYISILFPLFTTFTLIRRLYQARGKLILFK